MHHEALENIFRSVNIALVKNSRWVYGGAMGIDIWNYRIRGMTKPLVTCRFIPGPGDGRHCHPLIDPVLPQHGKQAPNSAGTRAFMELAGEDQHGHALKHCGGGVAVEALK